MKAKTWEILSLFYQVLVSVTGLALCASIALFLLLYLVPKQTTWIFGLLK